MSAAGTYAGRSAGIAAYRDAHVGSAHGASPHAVVAMLLDGAIARLAAARGHVERGEVPAKAEALSRALAIVEALRLALDHGRGGEIAHNLEALYEYVSLRITEGNLNNSTRALDEAAALLGEVRSAWSAVAPGAGG
ncbi:MAG: flagellar export chaperone FliS [Steroidobacteraceae bacterium]